MKEKGMIEDEKEKEVRTYADVSSSGRSTDQLSNGEEVIKFNKF